MLLHRSRREAPFLRSSLSSQLARSQDVTGREDGRRWEGELHINHASKMELIVESELKVEAEISSSAAGPELLCLSRCSFPQHHRTRGASKGHQSGRKKGRKRRSKQRNEGEGVERERVNEYEATKKDG